MRIRFLISSAAILTTFLAGSALTGDAAAQKGALMSPSTGWSVTKIDNRGGAYCAMARQFNQDTVLTIARNSASETSFALDFQRGIFRAQQDIQVTLDPGAGEQRVYRTQAVSDNAFVVRLGQDGHFFDALERTGFLRVEAGGQSYSFNIADIDVGASRLDSCVANMVMPAAGEELLPVLDVSADAEREAEIAAQAFRQEINTLRRQIKSLSEQNEALKNSGVAVSGSGSASPEAVQQLSSRVRVLEDENITLQKELDEALEGQKTVSSDSGSVAEMLRNENAALKEELAGFQSQGDLIGRLETEISGLKTRNENLRASIATKGQDSTDIDALREQVASLTSENTSLKSALDSRGVDAELLEQLREQIAQAENENRLLEETAAQAQSDLEERLRGENAQRIAELEQELLSVKAQKDEQLLEVGDVSSDLAALQEENAALLEKIELMEADESEFKALGGRIEALEGEKQALQAELDEVRSSKNDVEQQLLALGAENEDLKAALQENEEQSQRIADLEKQRDDLRVSLRDVVALVDGFKAENTAQKQMIASLKDAQSSEEDIVEVADAAEGNEAAADPVPEQSVIFTSPTPPRAEPSVKEAAAAEEPDEERANNQENVEPAHVQTASTKPVVKKEPQPPVKSVMAPVPNKKPEIQDLADEDLNLEEGISTAAGDDQEDELYQTLAQIEQDIRNTKPEDTGRLQALVREHEALKAIIDRQKAGEFEAAPVDVAANTQQPVAYDDVSDLNQAQIYERSLKRKRDEYSNSTAAVVDEADMADIQDIVEEELPVVEENIALRRSADPFEEIDVQDAGNEAVAAVMQEERLEKSLVSDRGSSSIRELIARSNVASPERIREVSEKPENSIVAYQWNGDGIYGSAEQKHINSPEDFDSLVMDYLQRTESRCPGEFAVVPDNTVGTGAMRADSYEVACVSGDVSSGASLLFFNQGGEFTVVAHEAPAEELGLAIEQRNKVMRTVTGS